MYLQLIISVPLTPIIVVLETDVGINLVIMYLFMLAIFGISVLAKRQQHTGLRINTPGPNAVCTTKKNHSHE